MKAFYRLFRVKIFAPDRFAVFFQKKNDIVPKTALGGR